MHKAAFEKKMKYIQNGTVIATTAAKGGDLTATSPALPLQHVSSAVPVVTPAQANKEDAVKNTLSTLEGITPQQAEAAT